METEYWHSIVRRNKIKSSRDGSVFIAEIFTLIGWAVSASTKFGSELLAYVSIVFWWIVELEFLISFSNAFIDLYTPS